MKKPHFYFRTYLAALLMLTAVPAKAADVKELFAIDLADYPGKGGGENLVRATCRFHRYLRLKGEHARERRAPADRKVSGLLAGSMATVGKEEVFDQCRTRSR
jgi:hypothetical protein